MINFPDESAFDKWFKAVEAGDDAEWTEPKYLSSEWKEYLHRRQLALGAWREFQAEVQRLNATAQPDDGNDGYVKAFYEIASILGISAQPNSPKHVFETVMKPMLQGLLGTAQPVSDDRSQVRAEHAEWSQATFGNVGPIGPLKHLSKEALEAAAEPGDLSEWADMQFLLWDAQRRAGITDEQITQAMIEKLAVNKSREWPEPKDGEPRLHVKPAAPGGQD